MKRTLTGRSAVLLCVAGLLLSASPTEAATKTTEKQFAEAPPDEGLIYFLRPGSFQGIAGTVFIFLDDTFAGTVDSGSYTFAYASQGLHLLWLKGQRRGVELEVEPGTTYYFQVFPKQKELSVQEGEQLLADIESYAIPTSKETANAEKTIRKRYPEIALAEPEVYFGSKSCRMDVLQEVSIGPIDRLGVELLDLEAQPSHPQQVLEQWAEELPQLIVKRLVRRGIDAWVEDGQEEVNPGPRLTGAISAVQRGEVGGRLLRAVPAAEDEAYMRARFQLLLGEDQELVATLECARAGYGGEFNIQRWLNATSKRIMRNHMERFATEVADLLASSSSSE